MSLAIGLLIAGVASTLHSSAQSTSGSSDRPIVAEAGGWRLAVSRPVAGGTSAPQALLCYEVTGTSREPTLALEVTPMWPGAGPAAAAVHAVANVGRASVIADLSAVGDATVDLRVQLVVDGAAADRPTLVIPGVMLRAGTPRGTCAWTTATVHHP